MGKRENAAETLIGVYKMAVIRKRGKRGPWHHREAVTFATLGWVEWTGSTINVSSNPSATGQLRRKRTRNYQERKESAMAA